MHPLDVYRSFAFAQDDIVLFTDKKEPFTYFI